MKLISIVAVALALGAVGTAVRAAGEVKGPLVISHRGFPCMYPEETLEGYERAIDMGVDFIEMDVVSTKDDVLILRHDILLDNSTNIKDIHKFQARYKKLVVDGHNVTGFFAVNMTYEELDKYVRCRQRLPFRDHSFDDSFKVPKLEDVLLMLKKKREEGKRVGAYIETKHPKFHDELGKSLEGRLVELLNRTGLLYDEGAIYLQSFERESLKKLHGLLDKPLPATWLIGCDTAIPTLEELKAFKEYGTTIGPDKTLLVELNTTKECSFNTANSTWCPVTPGQQCLGRLSTPLSSQTAPKSELLDRARAAGLGVHAYTFRNEDQFMALDFMSDPFLELNFYAGLPPLGMGIEGVFIDCPNTSVPWKQGRSWDADYHSVHGGVGIKVSLNGSGQFERRVERVEELSADSNVTVLSADDSGIRRERSSGVVAVIVLLSVTVAVLAILYTRARRRLARGDFRQILDIEMNQ